MAGSDGKINIDKIRPGDKVVLSALEVKSNNGNFLSLYLQNRDIIHVNTADISEHIQRKFEIGDVIRIEGRTAEFEVRFVDGEWLTVRETSGVAVPFVVHCWKAFSKLLRYEII